MLRCCTLQKTTPSVYLSCLRLRHSCGEARVRCASASATNPAPAPTATALPTEGREAIKIGFGGAKKQKAKGGLFGTKKPKLQAGLAAFAVDEDEDT